MVVMCEKQAPGSGRGTPELSCNQVLYQMYEAPIWKVRGGRASQAVQAGDTIWQRSLPPGSAQHDAYRVTWRW